MGFIKLKGQTTWDISKSCKLAETTYLFSVDKYVLGKSYVKVYVSQFFKLFNNIA